MILAIDIGNTNIVFGCAYNNDYKFISRIATDRNKTQLEYAINFKKIIELHMISASDIDGAIISSVVPPLTNIIKDAVKTITNKNPLIIGPGIKTGLNILIDNPAQMGSDRVVDAVAAIKNYAKPIIIFDMGTATTISVIDEKSNYIGGMILPGIGISLESLKNKTSQLPNISLEAPKNLICKNTVDCMKSGIINGNASMMDGIIEKIENQLQHKATIVATGGWSCSIIPHCQREIIYDKDLLLKGLLVIYNKNIK